MAENKEEKLELLPNETELGRLRRQYKPIIPDVIKSIKDISITSGDKTESEGDQKDIKKLFPLTYGEPILNIKRIVKQDSITSLSQTINYVTNYKETKNDENKENNKILKIGVVLSGGQASGGHNVITGLYDALKELNLKNELIGFLDGPIGVMKNKFKKIDDNVVNQYRNTGGFDMIASGRDKIETDQNKVDALKTVNINNLDGLVVIGGDDSNTNAAILAEYFATNKSKCVVVGVPKTIDGDLQNKYIEISFGFDTAVKTFSEMISNICRDSKSARKAWHFIKLMGRDASHVTLDCALQTHPNITLIGEEIQAEELLLHDVTQNICDIITTRALKHDKNYGVVLIPEGVIQFIPSMKVLIATLTEMLKKGSIHLKKVEAMAELSDKIKYVKEKLAKISKTSLKNFEVLPRDIQAQLLLERDPHGNIQMSQIPIENLFIMIVQKRLKEMKSYSSKYKFRGQGHFFGYDGRSCYPSNFDAQYCYALGRTATILINNGSNGYMSRVYDLEKDVSQWGSGGIPITMLMNMEKRHGKMKPVIKKSLVDVEESEKFNYFLKYRNKWALNDFYRYIGPIQFYGPKYITDIPPFNVLLKKTKDVIWPLNNNKNNIKDDDNEKKKDQ